MLQYDAVEICNGEVLRNARIREKNQRLTWAVGNYDWGEGKRDEPGVDEGVPRGPWGPPYKANGHRPGEGGGPLGRSLDLERASAAAGGFHLRVAELETGTFERLDVVHFGAIEV